jgi:potassium-transporting ATPase KdpC subunit
MLRQVKTALIIFGLMVILTGLVYPGLMTGIAQAIFPTQANGSLVVQNGRVVGSSLIGQPFDDPKYFWGRPSATSPYPDNAAASSGSNLGPTNPNLIAAVQARIDALKKADPSNDLPIPVDLVTSSGSGLDPDISPAAAYYQAGRVARAHGLDVSRVNDLIAQHVQDPTFGFLGEKRVNILDLNLALDQLK